MILVSILTTGVNLGKPPFGLLERLMWLVLGRKDGGIWATGGRFCKRLMNCACAVIAEDKQHRSDLMTMFRHFDADKSGTLDVKEADNALNSLGLNQYERNSILLECNMEAQMVVTADEWIQMAELARKYRPSTQYNVIIGKFIRMMTSLAYKDKYRQEQELLSQNRLLQESFQRAPSVAIQV